MPKITVKKDDLSRALNLEINKDTFFELCFEFGIELDEIEEIRDDNNQLLHVDYKIEIPANRYDLLCFEGLTRALNVYLRNTKLAPLCRVVQTKNIALQKLKILPETGEVRPFCVAAVLRNISLDQVKLDSFIDLQEKLHHNICRLRTLVSIGTHDLDTVSGPFTYEALPPEDIKFIPLNKSVEYTGRQLMELYKNDMQLKQYLHIIEKKPRYPIIYDKNRVVLSLPPIINGDHSKISIKTKNIFIEVTATDLTKARIVLDTLVTLFSEYCDDKFTVEPCEIENPDGSKHLTPQLEYRDETISIDYLNQKLGLHEDADSIAELLTRMCLTSKPDESKNYVVVTVPPFRADVIHPCDILEDYAIAYGYNKIPTSLPQMHTTGMQQNLNKLTDLLRLEIAQAGFTELLTFTMCSKQDVSTRLNIPLEQASAVHISNPKAREFQVVRTSLIPGILKTIQSNLSLPKPIKVFEISDVVHKTNERDVGSKNTRKLCAAFYNTSAGFEVIHGLLEHVMLLLEVPKSLTVGYTLRELDDPTFFPGRCAEVIARGNSIGKFGILHPTVLQSFLLPMPCSVLEINIEHFL